MVFITFFGFSAVAASAGEVKDPKGFLPGFGSGVVDDAGVAIADVAAQVVDVIPRGDLLHITAVIGKYIFPESRVVSRSDTVAYAPGYHICDGQAARDQLHTSATAARDAVAVEARPSHDLDPG